MVTALADGAAALAARLRAVFGVGLDRTRALIAQSILALRALRDHLGLVFADGELRAQALLVRHLTDLLGRVEPGRAVAPLAERMAEIRDLQLHMAQVDKMAAVLADQVQRVIVANVRTGDPATAASAVVVKASPSAATAARTEANRAYNEASLTAIREMNAGDPGAEPYLKRIEEIIDSRNHPFSRVADGQTVPVDDPFRVSVAAVRDMAAQMGKSVGGIFWPQEGGFYVGQSMPGHYNERGRVIPWRASWGP